jgi:hypothetical protein
MEKLIRAMAQKVDRSEAIGYLVSSCTKDFSGEFQIITGARTTKDFKTPFNLYGSLLGKLFHTITKGYPEPEKLLNEVLEVARKEFKEAVEDESKILGEFTIIGKL